MSLKSIAALLLLSCIAARGSSTGVTEEHTLQEGTIIDVPKLTISEVQWIKNKTSAAILICTSENLTVGDPKLLYNDVNIGNANFDGDAFEGTPNCAIFPRNVSDTYTFSGEPARYELLMIDGPNSLSGRGITEIAITVRTTLLICGDTRLTKITWTGDKSMVFDNIECLGELPDALDNVCYHNQDLTGTDVCFVVKDDGGNNVNVCLNGPPDNTPTEGKKLSVNYFEYGPQATLSLDFEDLDPNELRAIIRKVDGTATVYACPEDTCSFDDYEPQYQNYEVCAEGINEGDTVQTNATTFTDMKLYAFDGGFLKSTLVEFVFANGLDSMMYKASLYQNEPPAGLGEDHLSTVNVDCAGVASGHACFGFLDSSDGTGTAVYLALSNLDGTNTIVTPFPIPPPVRDELSME